MLTREVLLVGHPVERLLGWHGGLLATAVAGAALGELALAGRVESRAERLVRVEAPPLGHALLDAMASDLDDREKPARWVFRWARRAYAHTRDDLVAARALRRTRAKGLLITADGTEIVPDHPARAEAVARLEQLTDADPRTVMTAAILHVGSRHLGFPGRRERRFTAPAFRDAARDEWLAQVVDRAMRISVD